MESASSTATAIVSIAYYCVAFCTGSGVFFPQFCLADDLRMIHPAERAALNLIKPVVIVNEIAHDSSLIA
jgi:hypothetical protein